MKIENNILVEIDNEEIKNGKFTIPDSVTSIGNWAFEDCSSLTSVTIGDGVKSIESYAFYDCSKLTSITIPDGVTSIGREAFYGCSSLTSVYYTGDIVSWCGITFGNYVSNPLRFAHNLYINNKLIKDIVIPDTVTEIKANTFSGWNGTRITIPDSVTSIGEEAFYDCGLTSITIPDSITSIGGSAFYGCRSLISKKSNYKAFRIEGGKLVCRNKEYKADERSFVKGKLTLCYNGIHYCTNLFEIFNYYYGEIDKDIAIYEIQPGSQIIEDDRSSKCCTNSIELIKRLYREDIIKILNESKEDLVNEC